MAINKSFQRPKLTQTVSKSLSIQNKLWEDSGKFILDLFASINSDLNIPSIVLLARIIITPQISKTTLSFTEKIYTFPGNTFYDLLNPQLIALNAGTETNTIDLDRFLTDAGDAREDS